MLPQIFWRSYFFTVMDLGEEILAVIKAKEGATGKLLIYLKAVGAKEIKVMAEGPYGESCILPHYDSQLLMCGGSEIPGPLSYVLLYSLPRAVLVIACREQSLLQAFKSQIDRAMRQDNVQIYVTRADLGYGSMNLASGFNIQKLRPDLHSIVESIALLDGTLAVMTCGPPVFVDEFRHLIASRLLTHPGKPIEHIEEYHT